MQPTLQFLSDLANEAGDIIRAGYGTNFLVRFKSEIDPVTEVDQRSEDALIRSIRDRFPLHTLITEESGKLNGSADYCWYIDPLDGTVNFSHGVPMFSVSIAYAEYGVVQLGAVFDPMRQELFTAQRGAGAWLNGEPIHVSAQTELLHSLLVTGFPYNSHEIREVNLSNFAYFMRRSQGVRRLGSAALDLCYVAAGRLEGYWEMDIHPWDIAAGALIVEEAGGTVTTLQGAPDYFKPPYDLISASPAIHAQILAGLRENGS